MLEETLFYVGKTIFVMPIAYCKAVRHHNLYNHTESALLHVSTSFDHHQKNIL